MGFICTFCGRSWYSYSCAHPERYQARKRHRELRSLKVHRATVERQWATGRAADADAPKTGDREEELFTTAPDSDDERGEWTPEELEAEEGAQIVTLTAAAEVDSPRDTTAEALWRREQALLERMQEIAEQTRHRPDAKTRRLIDWIRENLCPELPKGAPPKWNNRRVLIFTENREGTKRHLKTILEQATEGTDRADERIEMIDGLTSGSGARRSSAASTPTPPGTRCASSSPRTPLVKA